MKILPEIHFSYQPIINILGCVADNLNALQKIIKTPQNWVKGDAKIFHDEIIQQISQGKNKNGFQFILYVLFMN